MSDRADTRRLFAIVIAGIVLYVVLDAIAQLLPPHYNPISQAESDLAVGPYGYVMTINFLDRGILSLVFIYALARTIRSGSSPGATERRYPSGSGLFAVWAIGAILLAIFPTDVPATPVSWHGAIHLVVAILAFLGGAFGELRLSTQFDKYGALKGIKPAAMAISIFAVIAVLVDLGLPFVLPHFAGRIGGLTERIFLGSVLLWMAVVSAYLIRHQVVRKSENPTTP
jgi:hypothetical membrane protein